MVLAEKKIKMEIKLENGNCDINMSIETSLRLIGIAMIIVTVIAMGYI